MVASKEVGDRVSVAQSLGLHPLTEGPAEEGTHYEVLSYTLWTDLFVPTLVRWENGESDDLTDKKRSENNMEESIAMVSDEVDS